MRSGKWRVRGCNGRETTTVPVFRACMLSTQSSVFQQNPIYYYIDQPAESNLSEVANLRGLDRILVGTRVRAIFERGSPPAAAKLATPHPEGVELFPRASHLHVARHCILKVWPCRGGPQHLLPR